MNFTKYIFVTVLLLSLAYNGFSQKTSKKMLKANEYFEAGEYLSAYELYDKLYLKAKTKSEKAEISYKAGVCNRNLYETNQSIKWFRRAILYKYQNPLSRLYIADAYKMNGKYEDAKEYYEEYKDLVPNDPRGQDGLTSCDLALEWLEAENRYRVVDIRYFNSKENDFAPAYARDSTEFYFTTTRESVTGDEKNKNSGENFADIFFVKKDKNGRWSEAVPAAGEINTEYDEGACSLTSNGKTMYFTSCQIVKDKDAGCQIYTSNFSDNKWSLPEHVKIFNDSSISVGHPSISPDELTLYFVADKPEVGAGLKDIWKITRKTRNSEWGSPQVLNNQVNTKGNELFPHMSEDGSLYFASDGHLGMGGLDIFKATPNKDDGWDVENMKYPINSPGNDFGLITNIDHEDGYLSSSRTVGRGDNIFYYYKQPLDITIVGIVYNDKNGIFISDAKITMEGSDGTLLTKNTNIEGKFSFKLNERTSYKLISEKKNFLKGKTRQTTKGITENTVIEVELYMMPIIGDIPLPNIQYDLNDTILREESKVALEELIEQLNDNPITIELMAHTDCRGDEKSNEILSRGRANSVVAYLIECGIDKERMVAKGYGETTPFVVDEYNAKKIPFLNEGDVLTEAFINALPKEQQEAAHQLNRRTEFKILSVDWGEKYIRFDDN